MTARTFSGASDFLAKFHDYGLGVIIISFGQHPSTFVCGSKASPINSVLLSLLLACLLLQVHSASFPRIGLSAKSSRFSRCQAGSGSLCVIGQLYVSTTSKCVTEASGYRVYPARHYHPSKDLKERHGHHNLRIGSQALTISACRTPGSRTYCDPR